MLHQIYYELSAWNTTTLCACQSFPHASITSPLLLNVGTENLRRLAQRELGGYTECDIYNSLVHFNIQLTTLLNCCLTLPIICTLSLQWLLLNNIWREKQDFHWLHCSLSVQYWPWTKLAQHPTEWQNRIWKTKKRGTDWMTVSNTTYYGPETAWLLYSYNSHAK